MVKMAKRTVVFSGIFSSMGAAFEAAHRYEDGNPQFECRVRYNQLPDGRCELVMDVRTRDVQQEVPTSR
jgi:hypothetical protein